MMSNILVDIVDDIEIKPSRLKLVLKWVVSISVTAIIAAFTFGQIKNARSNRLNVLENQLNANTGTMIEIKEEMKVGFQDVNTRINKIYDDGYKAFYDFQMFNNKQLGLIIDYSNTSKDLLKRMIELNSMEQTKQVETGIEQAKESFTPTIVVKPLNKDTLKIKK
jgi:hypothetical protein